MYFLTTLRGLEREICPKTAVFYFLGVIFSSHTQITACRRYHIPAGRSKHKICDLCVALKGEKIRHFPSDTWSNVVLRNPNGCTENSKRSRMALFVLNYTVISEIADVCFGEADTKGSTSCGIPRFGDIIYRYTFKSQSQGYLLSPVASGLNTCDATPLPSQGSPVAPAPKTSVVHSQFWAIAAATARRFNWIACFHEQPTCWILYCFVTKTDTSLDRGNIKTNCRWCELVNLTT